MATPTGLEPVTSSVTGSRANQLHQGAKLQPIVKPHLPVDQIELCCIGYGSFDGDRTRDLQCDRLTSTPLLHEAIYGGEKLFTVI